MSKEKWDTWRKLRPCKEWRYIDKSTTKVEYRKTITYFAGCECQSCEFENK